MNKESKCKCPICNGYFTPIEGLTPEEYLASGIIQALGEIQSKQIDRVMPCPRCGKSTMKASLHSNALSRSGNIYICDTCGNDEAVRALEQDREMRKSEWALVKQFMEIVQVDKNKIDTGSVGVEVPYISEWDGGVLVETTALINLKTGEVTDIKTANVEGLGSCDCEYIIMNDERVEVLHDAHGFEHCVELNN